MFNKRFKKLLIKSKDTEIGKQYDFNSIKNYNHFSEEYLQEHTKSFSVFRENHKWKTKCFWSEKINWFAQSSGTTNSISKFIL